MIWQNNKTGTIYFAPHGARHGLLIDCFAFAPPIVSGGNHHYYRSIFHPEDVTELKSYIFDKPKFSGWGGKFCFSNVTGKLFFITNSCLELLPDADITAFIVQAPIKTDIGKLLSLRGKFCEPVPESFRFEITNPFFK